MAATIKPIEAKSVHQIQSGQVIVDLCSVVKELVENALDAEATSIEVRLKNYGLESIEVQDNGIGISEANYESIALKHYTSKLSNYDDLSRLQTFGFRGEALSSLCALSTFSVITAQAGEAPKGKRLEFETSGKLKSVGLTAAQKGTTVTVEKLFVSLPVRQKELTKNIKREYGKVIGLLHAYACVSTGVKFTVKNGVPKGRSAVVFSTNGNTTTRENIANVYGAKMLSQLIELDLELDFQPTMAPVDTDAAESSKVGVYGYISKPVFGEGRQTPDRQMFFVNGRPCGLTQIGKAINEVYKSYNVSQSAFIFADLRLNTNSYDVNVSPDKRTIFLHNAVALTEKLKEQLTKLFDEAEQTVPQNQTQRAKLPGFRQLTMSRESSKNEIPAVQPDTSVVHRDASLADSDGEEVASEPDVDHQRSKTSRSLFKSCFSNISSTREEEPLSSERILLAKIQIPQEREADKAVKTTDKHQSSPSRVNAYEDFESSHDDNRDDANSGTETPKTVRVSDFNARMQEQQIYRSEWEASVRSPERCSTRKTQTNEIGVVPTASNRIRPRKLSPEIATIIIGDQVITKTIGPSREDAVSRSQTKGDRKGNSLSIFSQSLRKFDAGREKEDDENERESTDGTTEDDSTEQDEEVLGDTAADSRQDDATPPPRARENVPKEYMADFTHRHGISAENRRNELEQQDDRSQEEYRVEELIRLAESTNYADTQERQKRTAQALKISSMKDSTTNQLAVLSINLNVLLKQAAQLKTIHSNDEKQQGAGLQQNAVTGRSEEERLSLSINKSDFAKMHIAGQFNLGFIIALRHKNRSQTVGNKDELFIIDQHASDEKYNFERLQAETVVSNQRLVTPIILDLTAVEEEVVLENVDALQRNGFIIDTDTSGDYAIGQRCRLLSLPLSREVTFNTKDLEELIHLLSETHILAGSEYVPRPSKVRKMFAMRACRCSIMIGKTLSMRQMRSVLDHMGQIDKPWNCPHGRPTMRHLISLNDVEEHLWVEGDGLCSRRDDQPKARDTDIWKEYTEYM